MKRIFALLLCIALILASQIPTSAENDAENVIAFGLILPGGIGESEEPENPGEPENPDEPGEGGDTESPQDIWDVVAIEQPFDVILALKNSKVELPKHLYVIIQNQSGVRWYYPVWLQAQWIDAPYDTSICGDFEVDVIVSASEPYDMLDFTQKEYILTVTLRVTDPIQPNLLDGGLNIYPYKDGYNLEILYPVGIDEWDEILLEVSLDEGKLWRDAQEIWNVDFYPVGLDVFPLPKKGNALYYFRLTVTGNGLVQGMSDIMAIDIKSNGKFEAWSVGGDRDGGDRGKQPNPPPSPSPKGSDVSKTTVWSSGTRRNSFDEVIKTESEVDKPNDQIDQSAITVSEVDVPAVAEHIPAPEQDGADFVTLSGKRLAALIRDDEPIPIIKNDVRLLIPAELIRALDLSENNSFTVFIQKPGRNVLCLSFYVDNFSLSDPFDASFDVFFPYVTETDEDSRSLVCVSSTGVRVPVKYSEQHNQISFSLNAGGEYAIIPMTETQPPVAAYTSTGRSAPLETHIPAPPQPEPSSKPDLSSFVAILVLSAGLFLCRLLGAVKRL